MKRILLALFLVPILAWSAWAEGAANPFVGTWEWNARTYVAFDAKMNFDNVMFQIPGTYSFSKDVLTFHNEGGKTVYFDYVFGGKDILVLHAKDVKLVLTRKP